MPSYYDTITNYFKRGKKPTQGQYADTFSKVYLKDQAVPIDALSIGEQELVSASNAVTWDVEAVGTNAYITLTEDTTLTITNWAVGRFLNLAIQQDGSGGWNLTLPAGMKVSFGGAGVAALSSAPGKIDNLSLFKSNLGELCTALNDFTGA